MIIWIIGLSGSGKTTLANETIRIIKKKKSNAVLIDGDLIRKLNNFDLGHSIVDRKTNAKRISNLCKFLDDQNIHVICSILSIFPNLRSWNRKNFKNYFEVYIETEINDLKKRNSKGIYSKKINLKGKNIVGIDIHFPKPRKSNLIIKNNSSKKNLLKYAEVIAKEVTK